MDSAGVPLLYPLDSNSSPRGIAAAGDYCCRGFGIILVAEFRCRSLIATSIFCLGALCSARYRTRFSRFCWVLGRSFFIIGGNNCSFLRLRGVLPKSFVGFALTAVESIVLADAVMEYQSISSPNHTNAFYNMVLPSLFGEMDLHPTKLAPFRGQR